MLHIPESDGVLADEIKAWKELHPLCLSLLHMGYLTGALKLPFILKVIHQTGESCLIQSFWHNLCFLLSQRVKEWDRIQEQTFILRHSLLHFLSAVAVKVKNNVLFSNCALSEQKVHEWTNPVLQIRHLSLSINRIIKSTRRTFHDIVLYLLGLFNFPKRNITSIIYEL